MIIDEKISLRIFFDFFNFYYFFFIIIIIWKFKFTFYGCFFSFLSARHTLSFCAFSETPFVCVIYFFLHMSIYSQCQIPPTSSKSPIYSCYFAMFIWFPTRYDFKPDQVSVLFFRNDLSWLCCLFSMPFLHEVFCLNIV